MQKPRIPETDQGIQGEFNVTTYDELQRNLLAKGHVEFQMLIDQGMLEGHALEIGPGPGYLGLEWLKRTHNTRLTGLDISPDMCALAESNARSYGFEGRTEYRLGDGSYLPFTDETFDFLFSNGSLHEWAHPQQTLGEIWRVLKPGGKFCVSDLRRDMNWFIRQWMVSTVRPASMRMGLMTSIAAAYTPPELRFMLANTQMKSAKLSANPFGLVITGSKPVPANGRQR